MNMYQKRKMNENAKSLPSASINWLITIYPRMRENSDKIRDCEN